MRAQTRVVPTAYLRLQGCFSRQSGIQTMFQEEPTLNFLSQETKGGNSGKTTSEEQRLEVRERWNLQM